MKFQTYARMLQNQTEQRAVIPFFLLKGLKVKVIHPQFESASQKAKESHIRSSVGRY
jgi:hypothetical protein